MTFTAPSTPVWIWQHADEFNPLLDEFRARSPERVLEVGTYAGGTLYHWLRNMTRGRVVSVDTYAVGKMDNRALYPGWTPPGVELRVVAGDSHDPRVVEQITSLGPFDWVFLDGDHSAEGVREDWESFRPLVTEGGVVVFHDIQPSTAPGIHVHEVWEEIAREFPTRTFVGGDREWGGIGMVLL